MIKKSNLRKLHDFPFEGHLFAIAQLLAAATSHTYFFLFKTCGVDIGLNLQTEGRHSQTKHLLYVTRGRDPAQPRRTVDLPTLPTIPAHCLMYTQTFMCLTHNTYLRYDGGCESSVAGHTIRKK